MLAVIIGAILTATGITQTMPGRGITKRGREAQASMEEANNVQKYPDTCEVPQQPAFPSELTYYQNFHPADSIFDFWCKAQLLHGSGTFVAEIRQGDTGPFTFLYQESFAFDGTPHSTRRHLAKALTEALQTHISGERGVPMLMSRYGFPAKSVEGQRAVYLRELKLQLKGVEIGGTPFSVIGTFATTQEAIVNWLKGVGMTLEFPASFRSGVLRQDAIIAFPTSFYSLVLYSEDPKLEYSKADLVATLKTKYSKFQPKPGDRSNSVAVGGGVLGLYTDKANSVVVEEGNARDRKFLKISYAPNENGPLDPNRGNELAILAKAATEREAAKDKAEVDSKKTKNPL